MGQSRWNIHHYNIDYSAFSPVLYKVIDDSTIEIPPNKTSEAVVIRELEAGVEHRSVPSDSFSRDTRRGV